ncbi:OmpA family protein [Flammeovirga pacifica]|uniref:OmpA-like domain-containing protein n=1 Tax=Flammeovirga pacifica TaxID=915059 RepID=A0A1S1YXK2_FLAPC|nr:OmpA family protein [Flammeovirga pacifica]OHX65728.1 hypothetical protein NH26_04860 [Flammeovirga pacifica]
MKKNILLILLTLIGYQLNAQTIVWADTVYNFSSELSSASNSAKQALGRPNVPKNLNQHSHAWLATEDSLSSLTVGFSYPLENIHQIIVAESFYHNAIQQVDIITESKSKINVYNQKAGTLQHGSLISNFFIKPPKEKIIGIQVVLNSQSSTLRCGIDAIGVSTSTQTISVLPQVSELLMDELEIKKLSSDINTPQNENSPVLDIRGERLLFTRHVDHRPVLMQGHQENERWEVQEVIFDSTFNILDKYISAISPDGITALSVIDASGSEFQLSTFELSDSVWINQEQIIIPNVELLKQKSDFFLSNSRKVMLMSLTDHRQENTSNLYVSFKQENGSWSTPTSLGNLINTLGKESSPFLSVDGKTLYFASDGHQGFGGKDLFVAKRLSDDWTDWSSPENLGGSINTPNNESDLFIPITGELGYFSRSDAQNQSDIFSIKLPILLPPEPVALISGSVFDKKSKEAVHSRIIYTDLSTQEEVGTVFSNAQTGKYYITLPLGKEYGFLAQATGYLSESENINLKEENSAIKAEQELYLIPIEKEAHLTLNNIFFDQNSSYLKDNSFDELNRVASLLKNEPSIKKVEICGYTDHQGDAKYNQWLSEKRANSVRNYLIKKGVKQDRLNVIGKGELEPIADNSTPEGRKQNRRVVFTITELEEIN